MQGNASISVDLDNVWGTAGPFAFSIWMQQDSDPGELFQYLVSARSNDTGYAISQLSDVYQPNEVSKVSQYISAILLMVGMAFAPLHHTIYRLAHHLESPCTLARCQWLNCFAVCWWQTLDAIPSQPTVSVGPPLLARGGPSSQQSGASHCQGWKR